MNRLRVTRTRKARRTAACGYCAGPIKIGQREAEVCGSWMHTKCAITLTTPEIAAYIAGLSALADRSHAPSGVGG